MNDPVTLTTSLRHLLGKSGYLDDEAARLVYAADASHLSLGRPLGVALPVSAAELRQVVAACAAHGRPVVARGSGTGLSGGAVPPQDALVLGTGRLTALGPVDARWGRIRVEAGVLNESVSRRAAPFGCHFAPDPSSQSAASIGGNIAENAGGPHCLRFGVTRQHLLRLEWVAADGAAHTTGRGLAIERGLDLTSLLCGSEGTLGLVTAADLRLVPIAPAVVTLLAFFPVLDDATGAVVELLGQGLLPVAVEMVDQPMLEAVEAAFGFGFPTDVQAALIAEFSGSAEEVSEDGARAAELLRRAGARDVRQAADDGERAELWKCRKKAFGAVGRLAPRYVTMDVVVPLGQLPDFVREIQAIRNRYGVQIATAFHAGDGNLHPGVNYDDRDPDETRRAHAAADEIVAAALARGGSATGEHGVGIEKLHVLPWQMDAVTAGLHHAIKRACDPHALLNPGKVLPDPAASYAPCKPLPQEPEFQWDSLTVSAPVDTRLSALQDAALARGLWLPLGLPGRQPGLWGLAHDPTLGELLDQLVVGPLAFAAGTVRDLVLETWAETGGGARFHSGAPVFKNVAGYAVHHMLVGSGGYFARHLAATFLLRPGPERAAVWHLVRDAAGPADLAPLWRWQGACRGRSAPPLVVVDPQEGLFVLAAGRDRQWDLARARDSLLAALTHDGWSLLENREAPFADGAALLEAAGCPAWAFGAGDWTLCQPQGAATGRQGAAADCRQIRLTSPDQIWLPKSGPGPAGWHAEVVVAAGQPAPTPPPAPGVPVALLRSLKVVFDPENRLAGPDWLTAGETARD